MATRVIAVTYPEGRNNALAIWAGLLNGDDGAPYEVGDFKNVSVQAVGTFGAAGSVQMEGSNDSVNWALLGAAKTAAAVYQLTDAPRLIRPHVTAGDGTTALVVTLYARRDRIGS